MVSLNRSTQAMLSIEELKALRDQPDSGIVKVREEIHVALYPKYLLDIRIGIANYLNARINQWHPKLNGILAAYSSLKLFHSTGTLANEEAHIHLDVIGDFWLFRPDVGTQLKGVVTKKSPSHVSCLVHGVFNVPCYKPFDLEPEDRWFGTEVPVGNTVRFTVMKTDMSQKIPFILGKLLDGTNTAEKDPLMRKIQIVRAPDNWAKEQNNTSTTKPDVKVNVNGSQIEACSNPSKKSSKRKAEQPEPESEEDHQEEAGKSKKSKSKKKKKSRSDEDLEIKEKDETNQYLTIPDFQDDHFDTSSRKSSKKSKKKSKDKPSDEAEIEAQRDLLLQSLTSKVKEKKAKGEKTETKAPALVPLAPPEGAKSSKKDKLLLVSDRSLGDPDPSFMVPTSTPKDKTAPVTDGGTFEDPRQCLIGNMLAKFNAKKPRKSK